LEKNIAKQGVGHGPTLEKNIAKQGVGHGPTLEKNIAKQGVGHGLTLEKNINIHKGNMRQALKRQNFSHTCGRC
ncbi:hypothetical protein, partial [Vibrio splendidus]|uniref:hypothetical protein n=1 Tax=Vibrio splendidus TaxID=29497 RepID=UPI003D1267D5